MQRRHLFCGLLAAALLAACGTPPPLAPPGAPPEVRSALAPTGTLRIAVYTGSPTSLVRAAPPAEMRGVSVDIGRELARRLGQPSEVLVFQRVAEVIDALKSGRADFTITNATPARAVDVDFTEALIGLELGVLVLPGSPVGAIDAVDRPGMRIGVSQGSTSQAALTALFKQASVVPAPSLQAAREMLSSRQLDAFATNKGVLFEMADHLPGARVLEGRWGLEQLAIAVPKGRGAALPWLRGFAESVRRGGQVQEAARSAGLRGTVDTAPR
jgi:polar amino acid transport system substrate-binding protein